MNSVSRNLVHKNTKVLTYLCHFLAFKIYLHHTVDPCSIAAGQTNTLLHLYISMDIINSGVVTLKAHRDNLKNVFAIAPVAPTVATLIIEHNCKTIKKT